MLLVWPGLINEAKIAQQRRVSGRSNGFTVPISVRIALPLMRPAWNREKIGFSGVMGAVAESAVARGAAACGRQWPWRGGGRRGRRSSLDRSGRPGRDVRSARRGDSGLGVALAEQEGAHRNG